MSTINIKDEQCLQVVRKNIQRVSSWYVMAAYAYYVDDDPIISDKCFDKLGQMFLKAYPEVEHKYGITEDTLRAGTYLGQYPWWVKGVVEMTRSDTNE